jgi:hypothetical protein
MLAPGVAFLPLHSSRSELARSSLRAGLARSLVLQATPRCHRLHDGGACLGLASGSPCGQERPRVKSGTRRSLLSVLYSRAELARQYLIGAESAIAEVPGP